jgi:hypothetical protein
MVKISSKPLFMGMIALASLSFLAAPAMADELQNAKTCRDNQVGYQNLNCHQKWEGYVSNGSASIMFYNSEIAAPRCLTQADNVSNVQYWYCKKLGYNCVKTAAFKAATKSISGDANRALGLFDKLYIECGNY